ncbi:hypothetical protein AKJ16_DCAP19554, partial [Drosera capensis]
MTPAIDPVASWEKRKKINILDDKSELDQHLEEPKKTMADDVSEELPETLSDLLQELVLELHTE